ncbi:cbb3-type cytochrome oxidase assembly protein CcoS [Pseudoxanthobacter sp. M-2]|uniref:cbb3-type cytochrome oxidase assembly protein CcoS n=1 Tax=Pseudoxanthobacter sp. M-2 TaxID=3078754 RepID=UPI0038FC245E
MTVLLVLVPLALLLGLAGLFAFLWSLRSDQYSDLDGAAVRMLADDDLADGETPDARRAVPVRVPSEERKR